LRAYSFPARPEKEEREVMRKIFSESTDEFENLREFFLSWREPGIKILRKLAARFVRMVIGSGEKCWEWFDEVDGLFRTASGTAAVATLGEEIMLILRRLFIECESSEGRIDPYAVEAWCEELRNTLANVNAYNQSPVLGLESLYFRLRELV
jgi:hypothetical protein